MERDIADRPLIVQWIVGLIPHGGPIELCLVPASVRPLVSK